MNKWESFVQACNDEVGTHMNPLFAYMRKLKASEEAHEQFLKLRKALTRQLVENRKDVFVTYMFKSEELENESRDSNPEAHERGQDGDATAGVRPVQLPETGSGDLRPEAKGPSDREDADT